MGSRKPRFGLLVEAKFKEIMSSCSQATSSVSSVWAAAKNHQSGKIRPTCAWNNTGGRDARPQITAKGKRLQTLARGGWQSTMPLPMVVVPVAGGYQDLLCRVFQCSPRHGHCLRVPWHLHWPKAEVVALFHMYQHNNVELPLQYAFKFKGGKI